MKFLANGPFPLKLVSSSNKFSSPNLIGTKTVELSVDGNDSEFQFLYAGEVISLSKS